MSLMNNRNKKGPRVDPWGTPALTSGYENPGKKYMMIMEIHVHTCNQLLIIYNTCTIIKKYRSW
jgi:hypothetical protein